MKNEDDQPSNAAEMRQRAEAIFREKAELSLEELKAMSPDVMRQTLHELGVHQIELEMQNEELRRAQAKLDVEHKQAEAERDQFLHKLGERVKELETLHRTTQLFQDRQKPTTEVLQEVAAIIPGGWQYPEICAARILYDGAEFTSPNYSDMPWKQSAAFATRNGKEGTIEVLYLEARHAEAEGPFLAEERFLINTLAKDLSVFLERQQTEIISSRLAAIVESSDAGIISKNLKGIITSWNRGAETIFGYTADQMVGTSILQLIPADRQDEENHILEQIQRGEKVAHFETLRQAKDARLIPVSVMASPVKDAAGKVIGVSKVVRDITERKRAQEAMVVALLEREALLKEVHHRVKNNLQVIASLLRLEARRSNHADTKSVLKEMQGRIGSMALLHETLYRSGNFAQVDLAAYLKQLSTQLFRSLVAQPGEIRFRLNLESVHLTTDQTIPCGLIVNELVTNCLKHGFPDGLTGEVRLELQPVSGGTQLRLRVSDTGVGLPADFESKRGNSLGLQLVSDLARQLGGKLEVGPGPSAVFEVTFTPKHSKPNPSTPPV